MAATEKYKRKKLQTFFFLLVEARIEETVITAHPGLRIFGPETQSQTQIFVSCFLFHFLLGAEG